MKKSKFLDINYFIIFIVSLLLIFPLINNLYFEGHDTGYHIANILAISDNLSYHNLFNLKIFPLIANNFGYGSGIFYPQLSHFMAALIYNVFPNILVFTSLKITNFIIIFLSGILMYRFMKVSTKNKKLAFLATIFYLTIPYKIYDYLVRDAVAESLVFVFLPLIFLSFYYIFNKQYKKFYINFIIGYVGLINSHLVMTIYVTLFLIVILITQFKKFWNREIIKRCFRATGVVLLICLPFIIPLITHLVRGSYVVFDKGQMANRFGVYSGGLNIYHYFIGWPKEIGYHFLNIVGFLLVIYLIVKLKKANMIKRKLQQDYLFATGLICTSLGIWMSSLLFPWFLMPNFLLMIQFPWRLGTFTGIGISILVYYAFLEIKDMYWNKAYILSIIFCILVAIFCIMAQDYKKLSIDDYNLSQLGMGWQKEYLPVKLKKKQKYLKKRGNDILVMKGNALITNVINDTPYLKFRVDEVSDAVLELPRIYYLGYKITVDYGDKKENISYKENENGFIEISLKKSAIIEVDYEGTPLARISNKISVITMMGFLIFIVFKRGEENG